MHQFLVHSLHKCVNRYYTIIIPYYRGAYLWNQLDYKLQHLDSNLLFGKAVRKLDLNALRMYVELENIRSMFNIIL